MSSVNNTRLPDEGRVMRMTSPTYNVTCYLLIYYYIRSWDLLVVSLSKLYTYKIPNINYIISHYHFKIQNKNNFILIFPYFYNLFYIFKILQKKKIIGIHLIAFKYMWSLQCELKLPCWDLFSILLLSLRPYLGDKIVPLKLPQESDCCKKHNSPIYQCTPNRQSHTPLFSLGQ